jgi:hypothetical protein
MIKNPLVMLDKSHMILVTNNNQLCMKKVNKIHLHPLTSHIHIIICN